MTQRYDVAIIGGGPGGSTCGSLLMKYNPRLRVAIIEREVFPRDHIGESQLPVICRVLDEMGCWDKVEAANFPVKIGATYRWGRTDDLWDFEFLPNGDFQDEARPAKYVGQRRQTAFQVDRAIYDKILLDHAASLGCEVRQGVAVREIGRDGDRVTGLKLDDGSQIEARWYIDASGHAGILRRAMDVEIDCPTSLRNIAIWDYWQNADWMTTTGIGGTRIVIMSLGYGWIWFIPIGPSRTSCGLVIPAEYYKASGKRPQELYREALASEPTISRLMEHATSEEKLATTKDWSFLANRLAGENWYLVGESAGFADPILSAGMSLAHLGGRDVAYSILAMERNDYEHEWLARWYDETHRQRIGHHIRFADFWYTANGCFTDLVDYTSEIAKDAGLAMEPEEAWQWLGTGGFVDHNSVGANYAGYSLRAALQISGNFLGTGARYAATKFNVFEADLEGVERDWGAQLQDGRISRHRVYRRDGRFIPNMGLYSLILQATKPKGTSADIWNALVAVAQANRMDQDAFALLLRDAFDALESMLNEGWLKGSVDPSLPLLQPPPSDGEILHAHWDEVPKGA